jgi:hypothetical protein
MIRIIKAYKTSKITDLLQVIQEKVREEKKNRFSKKQKQIMKSLPDSEQNTQELIYTMSQQILRMGDQIEKLIKKVDGQNKDSHVNSSLNVIISQRHQEPEIPNDAPTNKLKEKFNLINTNAQGK